MEIGRRDHTYPEVRVDDKVYRKDMKRFNKLLNNFNPTPHLVEVIEGDVQMG